MVPFEVRGDMVKLREAWSNGQVADAELRALLPDAWLVPDSPEHQIGTEESLQMFRAAGFFTYPAERARPTSPVTLYRGSTVERRRGMSWTINRDVAVLLGRRHAFHGVALVFETDVAASDILAVMHYGIDDADTFIIDPRGIEMNYAGTVPDPRVYA